MFAVQVTEFHDQAQVQVWPWKALVVRNDCKTDKREQGEVTVALLMSVGGVKQQQRATK